MADMSNLFNFLNAFYKGKTASEKLMDLESTNGNDDGTLIKSEFANAVSEHWSEITGAKWNGETSKKADLISEWWKSMDIDQSKRGINGSDYNELNALSQKELDKVDKNDYKWEDNPTYIAPSTEDAAQDNTDSSTGSVGNTDGVAATEDKSVYSVMGLKSEYNFRLGDEGVSAIICPLQDDKVPAGNVEVSLVSSNAGISSVTRTTDSGIIRHLIKPEGVGSCTLTLTVKINGEVKLTQIIPVNVSPKRVISTDETESLNIDDKYSFSNNQSANTINAGGILRGSVDVTLGNSMVKDGIALALDDYGDLNEDELEFSSKGNSYEFKANTNASGLYSVTLNVVKDNKVIGRVTVRFNVSAIQSDSTSSVGGTRGGSTGGTNGTGGVVPSDSTSSTGKAGGTGNVGGVVPSDSTSSAGGTRGFNGTTGIGGVVPNDSTSSASKTGNGSSTGIHNSSLNSTSGILMGPVSNSQKIEKARVTAINNVAELLNTFKTKLISEGYDSTLVNRALASTKNYYTAVINSVIDRVNGGKNTNIFRSNAFSYEYYNASGSLVLSGNESIGYSHCARYNINNAISEALKSSDGIYLFENVNTLLTGSTYLIGIDKGNVWNKFCEFYEKAGGNVSANEDNETRSSGETATVPDDDTSSTGRAGGANGVVPSDDTSSAGGAGNAGSSTGVVPADDVSSAGGASGIVGAGNTRGVDGANDTTGAVPDDETSSVSGTGGTGNVPADNKLS